MSPPGKQKGEGTGALDALLVKFDAYAKEVRSRDTLPRVQYRAVALERAISNLRDAVRADNTEAAALYALMAYDAWLHLTHDLKELEAGDSTPSLADVTEVDPFRDFTVDGLLGPFIARLQQLPAAQAKGVRIRLTNWERRIRPLWNFVTEYRKEHDATFEDAWEAAKNSCEPDVRDAARSYKNANSMRLAVNKMEKRFNEG